jgi:ketosteroid isomerase-like protein
MNTTSEHAGSLHDVVAALERRQRGEWEGADQIWATEITYWRNGTALELSVNGAERDERMRRELATLRQAIPNFRMESTFHVDEAASVIVEVTTWSGNTRDVPGSAVEGDFYRYTACHVYAVEDGRIVRLDAYDDAATARRWNELMTHTRLLTADPA